MADDTTDAATPATAPKAKGGGGLKTILILALVLGLEGGTIGLTMWLTGGPKQVSAVGLESDAGSEMEKTVEVLVVKDRFPNLRTGRHFLYDTEIYITLKARHKDQVGNDLEAMQAQIKTEIGTLIRKAEPEWFQEATLATLRRQVKEVLDATLGKRSGEAGGDQPIIQDVLITKCIPFRADF